MADLGRAALVVSFGLALYALVGGTAAAITPPAAARRLGAARAHRLLRVDRDRLGRADPRARHARLHLRLRPGAHEPRPLDGLLADRVLGRGGGLAAPLAARADRLRRPRGDDEPQAPEGHRRLGRARDRRASRPSSASCSSPSRARSRPSPARSTAPASSRASRTRTWSPTRRCSTSATSASRSRSRSPPARCSRGTPTSAGSSPRAAGRSSPGCSSASARSSAPTGRTSRSAGAATTPGIRSRTPP